MATKKISELEAVTTAEDNDVLVIVDVSEGTTNKITKGNLLLGSGNQIEIDLNSETYQLVFKLKNSVGTVLSTATIDLPSENAITKIEYDQGELKITKQSGSIETVDITGLISGLVTESDFNTFKTQLQTTLEGINEKNEQQDEAMEENYKEITKLQEKLETQQEIINQMPQVEGQGTEITLENTIEAQFTKFDVEGNSVQDGTPSPDNEVPIYSAGDDINEFDKDNANVINGYIGTANKIVPYTSNQLIYFSVIPLKTYTIKKYIGNSNIWIATSENEPQITSVVNNLVKPETKEYTITMPENQNYLTIQVRLDVDVTEGYTLKDILNGIKIVEGTYIGKYTPYSPYGMGSITEKIVNENYLSLSEATVGTAGVTASISETKMKFNGKMASATNIFNSIREDKTIPAGTYKLSYKNLSGSISGSGAWAIYFNFYNANGTEIARNNFASNESGTVKDLVLSEDVAYYNYYAFCNSTSLIFNDLELGFMITKDTPTDYIAYKEQTYSIYTQQPFRSIGDVRDCFVKKSDGKLYERHYIGEVVLNGSENWSLAERSETSNGIFYIENFLNTYGIIREQCLSNYGTYITGYSDKVGQFDIHYSQLRFYAYNNTATINDWKNKLTEKNLVINGFLAEPLDLPCTSEQIQQLENLPSTYKEMTIIQSQDETPAYLEVSGIRDIDTMFDKVTNAIISLGGNV